MTMREEFESWAISQGYCKLDNYGLWWTDDIGTVSNAYDHERFAIWQASAAAERERCAKLRADVLSIHATGLLPDGSVVDSAVALWAEEHAVAIRAKEQ